VSASSPRNRSALRRASAFLLAATALLAAGCPSAAKRASIPPAEETVLRERGDEKLLAAVREGGSGTFAAIAVFRGDVFLVHAGKLEQSFIPVLDESGNAAILLLSPGQVLPLLKDPSVLRLAWFGPQGRLARLDPSLELDLLSRYGKGTEGKEAPLLVRFLDVPGDVEERFVALAGFRVVSRSGPTWVLSGPVSGLPRLLESGRIVYIEKASNP